MANLGDISVSAKKDAADMGAGNKKTGTAVYPNISVSASPEGGGGAPPAPESGTPILIAFG